MPRQQRLNFSPLPQGQSSLRPILLAVLRTVTTRGWGSGSGVNRLCVFVHDFRKFSGGRCELLPATARLRDQSLRGQLSGEQRAGRTCRRSWRRCRHRMRQRWLQPGRARRRLVPIGPAREPGGTRENKANSLRCCGGLQRRQRRRVRWIQRPGGPGPTPDPGKWNDRTCRSPRPWLNMGARWNCPVTAAGD